MPLRVHLLSGDVVCIIEALEKLTIRDVKAHITELRGYPRAAQKLLMGRRQLRDWLRVSLLDDDIGPSVFAGPSLGNDRDLSITLVISQEVVRVQEVWRNEEEKLLHVLDCAKELQEQRVAALLGRARAHEAQEVLNHIKSSMKSFFCPDDDERRNSVGAHMLPQYSYGAI